MKIKSNLKSQNGSITLFVLTSMLFLTIIAMSVYISSSNKVQAQQREVNRIQRSYEKQDINEIYEEHI